MFYFTAEVRNGVNDSEESIECVQNSGQNRDQYLVKPWIETNRTESSLQCRETEQTIGGTESESRIDSPEEAEEDNQKHIITETCLNRENPNKEDIVVDKSNDSSDDIKADEVNEVNASSLTETPLTGPTKENLQTSGSSETSEETATQETADHQCLQSK